MPDQNPKISTLWYALLGLIKMNPGTGYGLRKIFRETPMARYSSSPGAIYPALQNLESLKLIRGKAGIGKTGRETQTYYCTSAGTRELQAWLKQEVTTESFQHDLDVVLLRFSYLDLIDDPVWSIEFLSQFEQAARESRERLENLRQTLSANQPQHGQLALMNGVAILQAHETWAKSTLASIKRGQRTKR